MRFYVQTACDPVGDGLEVTECSVTAGSAAGELKQAVDCLDGGGGGVVFEVSEDAVEVPSEGSRELDEGLHARARAPGDDGAEVFGGILGALVVPHVGEELLDGERAGDLAVLAADLLAELKLFLP